MNKSRGGSFFQFLTWAMLVNTLGILSKLFDKARNSFSSPDRIKGCKKYEAYIVY